MKSLVRRGAVLACGAVALAALPASTASGAHVKTRYMEQVNNERILRHMTVFQRIADANGGTRASGTPGYAASRNYVVGQLRSAGYRPTVQAFMFPFFQELSPAEFERTGPGGETFQLGEDFFTMEFSGPGNVTGQVQAVDVVLPPGPTPNSNTSGCEASDFAGFTAGNVALVQRGTCTFGTKATNAAAAGASAVIVFNEGQAGRTGPINGTLGGPATIPALGASFDVGNALAAAAAQGPVTVRVLTNTFSEQRKTWNVFAEAGRGSVNRNNTIVVGAHLDSVLEGPGINDNGSGSAMILELARQLHRIGVAPKNRVRFAFWGAEESGLLGSEYYVSRLTPYRLSQIKLNLNFDMVASPNGVLGVYDGDGSDTPVAGPEGSADIEEDFLAAFDQAGFITVPSEFSGRSDYGPFIAQGIPAGGLFTGAEQLKTEEEAAVFGGVAGQQLDPCYHQPCDTLDHVLTFADGLGLELLDANSNAAAAVLYDYSQAETLPGAGGARASARARAQQSYRQLNGRTLTGKRGHLVR